MYNPTEEKCDYAYDCIAKNKQAFKSLKNIDICYFCTKRCASHSKIEGNSIIVNIDSAEVEFADWGNGLQYKITYAPYQTEHKLINAGNKGKSRWYHWRDEYSDGSQEDYWERDLYDVPNKLGFRYRCGDGTPGECLSSKIKKKLTHLTPPVGVEWDY